jgi:zinc/manganese transport system substrate-binding protein
MMWMAAAVAALAGSAAAAQPVVPVVAAENFYGDVARQIGGPDVRVSSILSNPDQDPHMFEASPSVGRALAGARIVVVSGVDYDPWMPKLLAATTAPNRQVIVVGDLVGRKPGDNPHIWYDPQTMRAAAAALADALAKEDPAHAAQYRQRLAAFEASLQPIEAKIAALHERLAGTPAAATEPVFGYMFARLGMTVRDMDFQMAVMNNTDPTPPEMAAFEDDLKQRHVRVLIYNAQASDPIAEKMEMLALASGIPVVGAAETMPPHMTYQSWMMAELDAMDRALPAK